MPFHPTELKDVAKQFGTPLFLYDWAELENAYTRLRTCLPDRISIHYALKANSNLAITHELRNLGACADVCSSGELAIARAAGHKPECIVYTGAAHTDAELSHAIKIGIGYIVVESFEEIRRISNLAKKQETSANILIRVNIDQWRVDEDAMPLSGRGTQFGFSPKDVLPAMALCKELPEIKKTGIHTNLLSGTCDSKKLLSVHNSIINCALELVQQGHTIDAIDFGGGLGVPYSDEDEPLDLEHYAQGWQKLIERIPLKCQLIMEVGRYLVADCGYYLMEVIADKIVHQQRFVMVNGGIHHLYRSKFSKANNRIQPVGIMPQSPSENAQIAGPLLTTDDVICRDVQLPKLQRNDLLILDKCGAYAFGHSLHLFCLHPSPSEIAKIDSEWKMIRSASQPQDFLKNQTIPNQ